MNPDLLNVASTNLSRFSLTWVRIAIGTRIGWHSDCYVSLLGGGVAFMERFIARENIRRFRQQLENCTNEAERATLQKLLADEEAKLRSLNSEGSLPPDSTILHLGGDKQQQLGKS